MLSGDKLKSEIDKIPKEYYGAIFDILKSFKNKTKYEKKISRRISKESKYEKNWIDFVQKTYGSLSEFPIERGEQGNYENRETIK